MKPFTIERTFNAPIQKVWKAITDKNEMKHWYFDLSDFKPEVGFKFQFTGQGKDGVNYIHLCEIKEVIPNKKLSYSWVYQGYEGYSQVSFELFAEGAKTKLKLTHSGLESFPAVNPVFAQQNFVEGWTEIIGRLLLNYLEKN